MSTIDGCRNLSPSSVTPWTRMATIVASASVSCAARRSVVRPLSSFVLISSPAATADEALPGRAEPELRAVPVAVGDRAEAPGARRRGRRAERERSEVRQRQGLAGELADALRWRLDDPLGRADVDRAGGKCPAEA